MRLDPVTPSGRFASLESSRFERSEASRTVTRAALLRILDAARLAPSADNVQPFRFALADGGFDLRYDPARATTAFDGGELASAIGAGAILETARLAATRARLALDWSLSVDASDPLRWARATVRHSSCTPDPLALAIEARHTNRATFLSSPLVKAERVALAGQGHGSTPIALFHQHDEITTLARLCGEADQIRLEDRASHADLHRFLRWTPEAAASTRDGLDVRTLGLTGGERFLLGLTKRWGRARVLNLVGGARAAAHHTERLIESASVVGVICAPDFSRKSAIEAGATLQRAWLRATAMGLAFSPFLALPLLVHCAASSHGGGLSEAARNRLGALGRELAEKFVPSPRLTPIILFRVGRAPAAPVRSLRRGLEDFLVEPPCERCEPEGAR